MKITYSFGKFLLSGLILLVVSEPAFSQIRQPRQEKLLNGLKLVLLPDPTADKAFVRIRVHSGSAFDPQGKEGVMKLLSEMIFATDAAREFFAEDLGGELEIISNYDFIQINASSRPADFLTLLETISAAVSNPTIDKETTEKLKKPLLAKIAEMEKDAAYVADRAAARRLYGTFPYGRPQFGSSESVKKIDFADIRFAKDRLLGADNVTVVIGGKFNENLAFRAARRYLGAWLKSDVSVPATFRHPDPPVSGVLLTESPIANTSEFRVAVRGTSRSDADYHAAQMLRYVLETRLKQREGSSAFVRAEAGLLPGSYVFGVPGWHLSTIKKRDNAVLIPKTDDYLAFLFREPISQPEFDSARRDYFAVLGRAAYALAYAGDAPPRTP
ncbi:MAG: insulinase family protein [Acidobacteria bacterium]|nr:insulinase family protein [Acidobacteriota bacterium]